MDEETRKLCETLQTMISKIMKTSGKIPSGFKLAFGGENVIFTVDVKLDIALTPEGEKDFKKKYGIDAPFKVLLNPEDL